MSEQIPVRPIGPSTFPSAPCPRKMRGFTLLETLIVVAIIGILAALALAALQVLIPRWRLQDAGTQVNDIVITARRYAVEKMKDVQIFLEDDSGMHTLLADVNAGQVYTLVAKDGARVVAKRPLYALASGIEIEAITFPGEIIVVEKSNIVNPNGSVSFSYQIAPTRRRVLTVDYNELAGFPTIEESEI